MTGVDSERFLIDDWDDLLYGYTFSALRPDLRFRHVLDRATLEGQKSACSHKVLSLQPRHGSAPPPHSKV